MPDSTGMLPVIPPATQIEDVNILNSLEEILTGTTRLNRSHKRRMRNRPKRV